MWMIAGWRPLQWLSWSQSNNSLLQACSVMSIEMCIDVGDCRLQTAAVAKLESVRQQSATGMQYALEQKKFTDISVSLQPACVIIPDQGVYRKWDSISTTTVVSYDLYSPYYASAAIEKRCQRHSVISSVLLWVSAWEPCKHHISKTKEGNLTQVTDVFGFVDVLIRFWIKGKRSRSQQAMTLKTGRIQYQTYQYTNVKYCCKYLS